MLYKLIFTVIIFLPFCYTSRAQEINTDTLLAKAALLNLNRQYTAAIRLLDTVLLQQPNNRSARMERAYNNFLLGNYKPSKEDLDLLLDQNKKDTQALFNRARLFLVMNEYGLAMKDIKHYIELKSTDPEGWYYKGHIQKDAALYNDALESLDKAIETAGGSHYKSFVVKGNIYTIRNKKEKAIEQYELAMQADSTQGLPYVNRGKIYLSKKDTTAALKDFDKAIAVNPDDEYTIVSVNKQLVSMGAIERVERTFNEWIEKDPASINGWMGRGYLQAYKENYTAALESFSKVLSFYPGYAEAMFYHGLMLVETGDKKAGREEIKKAAEAGYPPAKQYLGRTWKLVGNILARLLAASAVQ